MQKGDKNTQRRSDRDFFRTGLKAIQLTRTRRTNIKILGLAGNKLVQELRLLWQTVLTLKVKDLPPENWILSSLKYNGQFVYGGLTFVSFINTSAKMKQSLKFEQI